MQRNIKSLYFSFLPENFSGWEHCTTFGLVAGNMNSVIQIDVRFYYIIYLFFLICLLAQRITYSLVCGDSCLFSLDIQLLRVCVCQFLLALSSMNIFVALYK